MKITILCPQDEFALKLQNKLSALGEVCYTDSRREYSLAELKNLAKGSHLLGVDPDNLGGWEKVETRLAALINSLPDLKGVALDSTAFHYLDAKVCKKKGIKATYVPGYSSESVAEHSISLLTGLMKRIFVSDELTRSGREVLVMGHELKGKTLGIIGLGNIGKKVADLANGLGMKVIAYNRSPRKYKGVQIKSLEKVLAEADALSLHLATNEETKGFIGKAEIKKIKKGVFIVNTADRALIDEAALAKALLSGQVDSYALEAEEFTGPLAKLKNVFFFKGFGWYTKEALDKNKQMWVENLLALAKGKTVNPLPVE